jgi:hypothetical protein
MDTCGKMGFREKIIELVVGGTDTASYLTGSDTNKIIYLFGPPDVRTIDDSGDIYYQYYSMLLQAPDGSCFRTSDMEGEGMELVFDCSNKKLIKHNGFME